MFARVLGQDAFARLAVALVIEDALRNLNIEYPKVRDLHRQQLLKAKAQLEKE